MKCRCTPLNESSLLGLMFCSLLLFIIPLLKTNILNDLQSREY